MDIGRSNSRVESAAVEDSFARIEASASKIASLPFHSHRRFSHALLSPNSDFERHCIREAEAHELSLFRVTGQRPEQAVHHQLQRLRTRRSLAPSSAHPSLIQWPAPSPVKGSNKGLNSPVHEAQRLLLAAERLLQIYPLKRASEHVTYLKERLVQLQEAIDQDQDYINSLQNPFKNVKEEDPDLDALQAALKTEELEVIALRVNHEERIQEQSRKRKQAKAAALTAKPGAHKGDPPPPANAIPAQLDSGWTAESQNLDASRETPTSDSPSLSPKGAPKQDPPKAASPPPPQAPAEVAQEAVSPRCAFSEELLGRVAAKVWTVLNDSLTLACQGISALPDKSFESTLQALSVVSEPTPPAALQALPDMHQAELYILLVFLVAMKAEARPASPAVPVLPLHLLDRPPTVLALDPSRLFCTPEGKMGLVSMAHLKEAASAWAAEQRGWVQGWKSGEMPTKALYGLVAKGLLKIDRRTVKDPKIYFDPSAM